MLRGFAWSGVGILENCQCRLMSTERQPAVSHMGEVGVGVSKTLAIEGATSINPCRVAATMASRRVRGSELLALSPINQPGRCRACLRCEGQVPYHRVHASQREQSRILCKGSEMINCKLDSLEEIPAVIGVREEQAERVSWRNQPRIH